MRHLFGPVDGKFAGQNLHRSRAAGECLAFGADVDLPALADASWAEIEARFPAGWRPEFIAVWLPYTQEKERKRVTVYSSLCSTIVCIRK
jgi:hypothetical protein